MSLSLKYIVSNLRELGVKAFCRKAILFLRLRIKMYKGYYVHSTARISLKRNVLIGKNSEIQEHVIIRVYNSKLKIGSNTQINPFTVIYGCRDISIGDDVMIAPHCMIVSGNHNYKQVTVPMRHAKEISSGEIIIGNGAWIGANCTITDGVKIGSNAIVAANSVVLNDIGDFDVYAGCPAKFIYNRMERYGAH
jgi:acetyltransferase-like isoleucine patch superfamily enzyme